MEINNDILKLIYQYNAQYARAFVGDPNTTYDKILQRCNHNLQMVADHFEYADNIHKDLYGGDNEQLP